MGAGFNAAGSPIAGVTVGIRFLESSCAGCVAGRHRFTGTGRAAGSIAESIGGDGGDQPRRSVTGIERAALLGLRLVGQDEGLQEAIRIEFRGRPGGPP